jgi:cytoskeletal protein RodZ
MSGNRRKKTSQSTGDQAVDTVETRVVAIPKNPEKIQDLAVAKPPGDAPPAAKPRPKAERIGDTLRQARLDREDDLYLIADYLRIKPAFLIALENSQYDTFPADAYVIGFLRTYANFLGVDGKDAVDRYRYEMAGRRKKPILSMPTPLSEGRAPSGLIMVGATVAILLIYALWYGISSANRTEVNVPPPLPSAQQIAAAAPAAPDNSAAAGLTAPAPSTTPAKPATEVAVVTPPIPAPTPTPPAPVAAAIPPAVTAPVMAAPPMPPASPGIVLSGEASTTPDTKTDILGKNAKPGKDAVKDVKPAPDVKDSAKDTKATDPKDAAKDDKNQIYGNPSEASHIIIRATQSTWVMVNDGSGKAVFDHVMRAGDIYKVPNRAGLTLTTGNGNGITLLLDGVELPKVATGAPHVVRDIPLDPSRLTAEPPSAQ